MKTITTHHDGHGLNEQIDVSATDEPGPGGAHHHYEFTYDAPLGERVGYLQFQIGPRNVEGSTPGVTTEAVLAALIDHLKEFQAGPYPSEENKGAIAHLEIARIYLRDRANERAQRGVLGTLQA